MRCRLVWLVRQRLKAKGTVMKRETEWIPPAVAHSASDPRQPGFCQFSRLAVALWVAGWMIVFCVPLRRVNGQDTALELVAGTVAKFEQAYDIEIVHRSPTFPVRTSHGSIHGVAASDDAVENYAKLFATEFSLYPPELVRKTGLKRVVFCAELHFADQRRTAIPDFEHSSLYLDIERAAGDTVYVLKVLHHEYYHMIDYADDRLVYEDREWAALNAADFRYGTGGRSVQDQSDTSVLTDRYPGFLNHYSTTGVEEDKAELFANLMVDPAHVYRRMESDPVLTNKVRRLKLTLEQYCDRVDEKFWERVTAKRN
jgi:hypothetical protein